MPLSFIDGYYDTTDSTSASTCWIKWTTGTETAMTTNKTWYLWTSNASTNATVIASNHHEPYVDNRTPEQRAADEARFARERAATEQRAKAAADARAVARDRARALLLAMLSVQQREQLQRDRFFDVIAQHSRRRYRIHEGTHGNVRLLDADGREVTRYCAQPNNVPTEDAMLAQKLHIEHDESSFLKVANATRLTA